MLRNVRRIIAFYRLISPRRLYAILLGGVLATAPVISNLVYPLLIGGIIDGVSRSTVPVNLLWWLGGLYALTLGVSYLGEMVYTRHKFMAAQEIRERVFATSFSLPINKLREKGAGYFAKLVGDQINEAFLVLDYPFIRNIILMVRMFVILGLVFIRDKVLFGVFAANVVFVSSYSSVIDRATHSLFASGLELIRKSIAYLVETFENIHCLISRQNSRARKSAYNALMTQITKIAVKAETIRVSLDKLMVDVPTYLSQVLIIAYCSYSILAGRMTVGSFWVMWAYFSYVTEPLYIFRELSRISVQSAATIESVTAFFDEANTSRPALKPASFNDQAPVYDVKDLVFTYQEQPILNGVSFRVNRGEVLGIVGLSGQGKSTLLNVLLGFEMGYEGEVYLLGSRMKDLDLEQVFDVVGYYSQTVAIFNDSLETNIMMGHTPTPSKLSAVISDLGLQHLTNRPLGEAGGFISGGERQRVELARLMYEGKDILVIDEPLTNLDPISEKDLLGKLASFLDDKTAIVISHKPNVLKLATRLLLLDGGRVLASGTYEELMAKSDLFRRLIHTYLETAQTVVGNQTSALS